MNRLRLLIESVRHTRARQLTARLGLMLKRRMLRRLPSLGDPRSILEGDDVPPRAPDPPLPVFPPRTALAKQRGLSWQATLLNQPRSLRPPVAWHDPALDVGTRLPLLNLHYMEYLEAVDDGAFVAIVEDWIASNPPYRGIYWLGDWNAFALSIRVVVWMQQLAVRRLDPETPFAARVLGSLARQLRFLERNLENDIGGNHILKNVKALLWAGAFFSGPRASRWRALGERLLSRELGEQMLADGLHFERSPAYHAQVTADLLECWVVHAPGPRRDALGHILAKAAQALADCTHPDGAPSLFNDGGLTMAYAPSTIQDAIERGPGGRVAPAAAISHPAAGYFGLRGEGELILVDCGAVGPDHLPAHAHGDVLAFEWSARGTRIVIDTGVFEYDAGRKRARSRATVAHNTLTLDDRDQADFWKAFRVGRRPHVVVDRFEGREDGFVLEGSHDGYAHLAGAPRPTRRIDARLGTIEVEDRVTGGAGQRAQARLLLAPGFDCVQDGHGFVIAGAGLHVRFGTDAYVTVVDAPYWPDFGVEMTVRQIVLDYGPVPCAGRFTLSLQR